MNCNPFTLGHRYLIETASKSVDRLLVFVVEEDSSMFSFQDRIELVRRGTEDLRNVEVLPSGSNMISRKQASGEVISASRVRKLLEVRDFDEIRKMVPDTTYEFLQHRYGL